MWGWVSRVLTSMEQVAAWYHNGDMDAAVNSMQQTKGAMESLYHLDEIPDVEEPAEGVLVSEPLQGEKHSFWAISDPEADGPPIPLPSWFQLPIDNLLLTWKKEYETWESRKMKRLLKGFDSLPPKMNQAFEEWASTPTRVLLLDKKRKARVVNVAAKSTSQMKKTCLVLVLHPALEPENLRIQAGHGKNWNLRLLEGQSVPDVDAPDVINHFPGHHSFATAYVLIWLANVYMV